MLINRIIYLLIVSAFAAICMTEARHDNKSKLIDASIFKEIRSVKEDNGSIILELDTGNHIDTSYFVLISSFVASELKIDLIETSVIIVSPSDPGYLLSTKMCLNLVTKTRQKLESNSEYKKNVEYFLRNFSSKDCLNLHAILIIMRRDVYIGNYTSLLNIIDGLSNKEEEKVACSVITVASGLSRFPNFGVDSLLFLRMRDDLCR
jgi:hypothetical protein